MSRGRRYDGEPKLNKKKVAVTIILIVVIIMIIISIKNLLEKKTVQEMSVQTTYFTVYEDGKYGVIDNNGNYIINPKYDEMIIIPNPTVRIIYLY